MLDVADHENVSLIKQLQINSKLVDTRMVDGQLRLVARSQSRFWGACRPQIVSWSAFRQFIRNAVILDQGFVQNIGESSDVEVYESREAYISRFREMVLNALTQVHELGADGSIRSSYSFLDKSQIIVPDFGYGYGQLTTVLAIDVAGDPATSVSGFCFFTKGSVDTFSSKDSLYVFDTYANENNNHGNKNYEGFIRCVRR